VAARFEDNAPQVMFLTVSRLTAVLESSPKNRAEAGAAMSKMRDARHPSLDPSPFARRLWSLVCPPGLMLAALLVALPGAAGAQGEPIAETALAEIRALMAEKAERTDAQRRLDSQLLLELRRRRGHAVARAVPGLITGVETDPRDDSTLVDIKAEVTGDLLARIEAVGGKVLSQHREYELCRARVPLERLETLAAEPSVQYIRPAFQPITNKFDTSEGDVAHGADQARAIFGVDGTGVRLCALSDSVDYLAPLQASGDLPAVTVLPGQSGNPGTSEGTAMLEILYDLAPGAELYFATAFDSPATFASNILALRAAGCDVIVDDVFYPEESTFQDGIVAQAVNSVIADGGFYFSAAGNSGNLNDGTSGVWEGDFVPMAAPPPLAGNEVHDFGGGNPSNIVAADTPYLFTLQWSDPLGGSDNDYDLYLLDPTGNTVWAASTNVQNGDDDPFEWIDSAIFDDTNTRLVIVRKPGAEARYLHLNSHRGALAVGTDGQITGHAAARDAFAVAAVDVFSAHGGEFTGGASNPVEWFSSDGPRRIFFEEDGTPITPGEFLASGGELRLKPDVAAADGVTTATPLFAPFYGTSAAAPHAAALTALLLEGDPLLTPSALRDILDATALDIEDPGFDRDSGVGIFDARKALLYLLADATSDLSVTVVDAVDPVIVGDFVTYTVTVTNLGPDPAPDVVMTQTLPTGTTFQSAVPAQGGCGESAGTVTCTLGDVDAGASVGIVVVVGSAFEDTLSTTASVRGFVRDADASNDSATQTTSVIAPTIALTVDEVHPGSFGFGFGSNQHRAALVATFTASETSPLHLQVLGWDIDYNDEISVYLNGTQIGQLSRGPEDALNEGDLLTLAPILAGQNTLEFRQKVPGWTWGVTSIAVMSELPGVPVVNLTVDEVDTGEYGHEYGTNEHETVLPAAFVADGTSTYYLQAIGYDIDYGDEISVHLNGAPIGFLRKGPNNAFSEPDLFTLPATLTVAGMNTLEFRERTAGWTWGVTDLGVLSAPPTGSAPVIALTVDVVDPGSYGHNFGTNEHETVLAATFTGDGASVYYIQATGYDIDYGDEISVHLNGAPIGFLTRGPNNNLNEGDLFALVPPHLAVAGPNTIEFRQRQPGWTWGVTELGVLSAPPSGAPPVLALTLDVVDPGSYGKDYGTNEHETLLAATFTGAGASVYYLQVTGFDIDYPDEISVHLNGSPIGFLSKGPNNRLNAGDVFALLPPHLVATGQNTIEFHQRTPGWKWGVTELAVLSVPPPGAPPVLALTVDVVDIGSYGHEFGTDEHETGLAALFVTDGASTLHLQVTGYDIDYDDEISVWLNGTSIGFLTEGPNNGLSAADAFVLPSAALVAGPNVIEFRQRKPGWRWGVTSLGILTSPP